MGWHRGLISGCQNLKRVGSGWFKNKVNIWRRFWVISRHMHIERRRSFLFGTLHSERRLLASDLCRFRIVEEIRQRRSFNHEKSQVSRSTDGIFQFHSWCVSI